MKAICNRCKKEMEDVGGCSHASCGGIFVTEQYVSDNGTKTPFPSQLEEFPTLNEADFDDVVAHLKQDAGLNAEVVATGGGIDCIDIPCGSYRLLFGTAGENWGFSVMRNDEEQEFLFNDSDGECQIETGISSNETDASAVALAITKATMAFDQKFCGGRRG